MPYTQSDLAYIAGILDGEGYIGLVKATEIRRQRRVDNNITHSFRPTVRVNMVSDVAINFIQTLFGGNLYENPECPPQRHQWDLQMTNRNDCKRILEAILPFLKLKKRQAEILLSFIALRDSKPKTNASGGNYTQDEWRYWEELKKLNKRGC